LPQDIDRLVQTVYGEAELPAGLDPKAERYILVEADGIHRADANHERRLAANAVLNAEVEPQNAYVGKPRGSDEGDFPGIRNVTRLGEDSITVLPVHTDNGAWRLRPGNVPFDPAVKPSHSLAKDMLARQLKLSRWDVVKALRDAEVPKGFAEHPWLRDVKPLCLKDGAATVGNVQVRLDPVLGIVYRQIDAASPDSQETIA
jgi:CRISPR-associated endonuclease/helicase Cas3